MTISVAVVHHEHGIIVYVAKTPKGLTRQLAEYAADWWSDISDKPRPPESWSPGRIVRTYFSKQASEYYDRYDHMEVED